jgi:uncharacterized NAD(P)/FAD-binding protein YdhS
MGIDRRAVIDSLRPDTQTIWLGLAQDEKRRFGEIIGQNGAASDVLYTLGSRMKGVLWEVVAVPEIRVQAERLARLLLDDDHPRRDTSSTHAR